MRPVALDPLQNHYLLHAAKADIHKRKGDRFQLLFQRWNDRGIDEEKILYDSDNTNDINNVFLWNMTVFVHNISLMNSNHNDTAK